MLASLKSGEVTPTKVAELLGDTDSIEKNSKESLAQE